MKLELKLWLDGEEIELGPHVKKQAAAWLATGEILARSAAAKKRKRARSRKLAKAQTALDLHQ